MGLLLPVLGFLGMGAAMAFVVRLVHAFMQHLGFLPGVLSTGGGGENEGGGAEDERGGFHVKSGFLILSEEPRRANDNSRSEGIHQQFLANPMDDLAD